MTVYLKGWRLTHFSEFLTRVDRKVTIDNSLLYKCVGVRWYGMGAFVREEVPGFEISRKQQWIVRIGDIIYNKLFAWKGAFAVADASVDGFIASDKFPTYAANLELISPRFLSYYFRSPQLADQARVLSKGAAAISKLTLNPPQFWELTIPLPSLEIQQRIVAQIDKLDSRIRECVELSKQAIRQEEALTRAVLREVFGGIRVDGTLSDALETPPRNGWSVKCNSDENGIAVLSLGAVTGFNYRSTEFKRISHLIPLNRDVLLELGDLLITRSNTPELVGHVAIYNGEPTPCIYPDLMMRLKIQKDSFQPKFVWYWLQTPMVREFIKQKAKGTSPTMKKISQSVVMAIPFPSALSISEQHRLVERLDILQAKLNTLKHLQAETAAELNAFMPSILGRAFNGEL